MSENERARLIAAMYVDKENQPFESSNVQSANLLQEQLMSSQNEFSEVWKNHENFDYKNYRTTQIPKIQQMIPMQRLQWLERIQGN